MQNLQTRLDVLERKAGNGDRIAVTYDDVVFTEGEKAYTQADIDEMRRAGWTVHVFRVVYDNAPTEKATVILIPGNGR